MCLSRLATLFSSAYNYDTERFTATRCLPFARDPGRYITSVLWVPKRPHSRTKLGNQTSAPQLIEGREKRGERRRGGQRQTPTDRRTVSLLLPSPLPVSRFSRPIGLV